MRNIQAKHIRPKFTWLFLATPNSSPECTPVVLRVDADTEAGARATITGWELTFAAKIRTEIPCRLSYFDYANNRCWAFENPVTDRRLPPTVGDRYTENDSGNPVIIREVIPGRVVFSYEQYPLASHSYPLNSFIELFTLLEVRHG